MSATVTSIDAKRFRDCVFFSLTLCRGFGNRAKVTDAAKLAEYLRLKRDGKEASTASNGATVQMDGPCKAVKQIIQSVPLDDLNGFMSEVKERLCGKFGMANQSKIKTGLFTVKTELVQQFEDVLSKAGKELAEKYVPAFVADYPLAIERAKTLEVSKGGLGPLFDARDYPDAAKLNDAFYFDWQWLALSVPEDLPRALKQAAQEKLDKKLSDAADEIKIALRESFRELIAHASDKLTQKPGEKSPIFRDSLIGNVQAFIESFNARNVMNDEDLAGLVIRAKQVLAKGVTPSKLREMANVRDDTRKQFDDIKTQLDKMIEQQGERGFNFSGD